MNEQSGSVPVAYIDYQLSVDVEQRLQSAILNFGSRPTSADVGSVTNESGIAENVGIAVGISLITAGFRHGALLLASAAILASILNS